MKRRTVCFLLPGIATSLPAVAATASEVKYGALTLTFDETSGTLRQIIFKGDVISETTPGTAPFNFATGAVGKVRRIEQMGFDRQLLAFNRPAPDLVEVTVRLGDFELVERYKLHEKTARLDRSASLTYRGNDTTVKLRGLQIRTPGVRLIFYTMIAEVTQFQWVAIFKSA